MRTFPLGRQSYVHFLNIVLHYVRHIVESEPCGERQTQTIGPASTFLRRLSHYFLSPRRFLIPFSASPLNSTAKSHCPSLVIMAFTNTQDEHPKIVEQFPKVLAGDLEVATFDEYMNTTVLGEVGTSHRYAMVLFFTVQCTNGTQALKAHLRTSATSPILLSPLRLEASSKLTPCSL
jgi:hypothetical protein